VLEGRGKGSTSPYLGKKEEKDGGPITPCDGKGNQLKKKPRRGKGGETSPDPREKKEKSRLWWTAAAPGVQRREKGGEGKRKKGLRMRFPPKTRDRWKGKAPTSPRWREEGKGPDGVREQERRRDHRFLPTPVRERKKKRRILNISSSLKSCVYLHAWKIKGKGCDPVRHLSARHASA